MTYYNAIPLLLPSVHEQTLGCAIRSIARIRRNIGPPSSAMRYAVNSSNNAFASFDPWGGLRTPSNMRSYFSFLLSKLSSISTLLGSRRKICQRALFGTWLTW